MYYKKELANLIVFDSTRGDLITLSLPKWAGPSGDLAVDGGGSLFISWSDVYISACKVSIVSMGCTEKRQALGWLTVIGYLHLKKSVAGAGFN